MSIICAKIVLVLCILLVYLAFQWLGYNIKNDSSHINIAKVKPRGHIRQNGDYWVWNNYIIADDVFIGNESITLATHASYEDLVYLPELLTTWGGPISISIFVCGTDFEKTIDSLRYIYTCLTMRFYMKRYLTIHLIFHDQHVPEIMKSMKMHELANYKHCKLDPAFQNTSWTQSYWRRRKLNYPRNLLRNVARINIFTYYVLSIDIHMLPTPDFPKKFLKFIRNHDTWRFADIPEPYTSVFCLPVFPIHLWDFVPKDKLQLRKLQVTRLSRRQKRWLDAPNPYDEVFIYEISKETDFCVVYVSINELEPLYDEQDENGSILEEDTNLKVDFTMMS
nr:beta-1,4-glucuronyltransferase 1-like [Drosophila bipectinata]